MTISVSKYSVRTEKDSNETYAQYMDYMLDSFVRAMQLCSPSWEVRTSKETIGNPSHSNFCCRTLLLQSTSTNEYLRVWALYGNFSSYYARLLLQDSVRYNPTSGSDLYLYKGNLYKFLQNSPSTYGISSFRGPVYFFGISDNPIQADFGQDLELKLPLFSLYNSYTGYTSQGWQLLSNSDVRQLSSFTIISDGSMFGVIARCNAGYGNNPVFYSCLYAPDLIECANQGDNCTYGVVSSSDSYGYAFNYRLDNYNSNYSGIMFVKSDGSFDYGDCKYPLYYINTSITYTSENSGKLTAVPMAVYLTPYTQSGSSDNLVKDGVGLKGWVNMKYLKFLNIDQSGGYSYGKKYQNASFISAGYSVLMCWDGSNVNPFI